MMPVCLFVDADRLPKGSSEHTLCRASGFVERTDVKVRDPRAFHGFWTLWKSGSPTISGRDGRAGKTRLLPFCKWYASSPGLNSGFPRTSNSRRPQTDGSRPRSASPTPGRPARAEPEASRWRVAVSSPQGGFCRRAVRVWGRLEERGLRAPTRPLGSLLPALSRGICMPGPCESEAGPGPRSRRTAGKTTRWGDCGGTWSRSELASLPGRVVPPSELLANLGKRRDPVCLLPFQVPPCQSVHHVNKQLQPVPKSSKWGNDPDSEIPTCREHREGKEVC